MVTMTDPSQYVSPWVTPAMTQVHGPNGHPFLPLVYFTTWTDNRVRVIDLKQQDFAVADGFTHPKSLYTHGLSFDRSGRSALGTGYFYDDNEIDVYRVSRRSGELTYQNPEAYHTFGSPDFQESSEATNISQNGELAESNDNIMNPSIPNPAVDSPINPESVQNDEIMSLPRGNEEMNL